MIAAGALLVHQGGGELHAGVVIFALVQTEFRRLAVTEDLYGQVPLGDRIAVIQHIMNFCAVDRDQTVSRTDARSFSRRAGRYGEDPDGQNKHLTPEKYHIILCFVHFRLSRNEGFQKPYGCNFPSKMI